MIKIQIDEAINGYYVKIQDEKAGVIHREIVEREIDVWDIIRSYATKQLKQEVDRLVKLSRDVEI